MDIFKFPMRKGHYNILLYTLSISIHSRFYRTHCWLKAVVLNLLVMWVPFINENDNKNVFFVTNHQLIPNY